MRNRYLFLLIVLILVLISCNGEISNPTGPATSDKQEKEHDFLVLYVIEGDVIESDSISSDSLIEDPYLPTMSYYSFDGWYKDSSYTTKWDFSNDKVRDNTVLYGKWNLQGIKYVNEKGDYFIFSDETTKLVQYCIDGIIVRTKWDYYYGKLIYIPYPGLPGVMNSVFQDEDNTIYVSSYNDMISNEQLYLLRGYGVFTKVI